MQTTLRMNICGVELEQSRNKGYCMRHCDGLTNILCLLFFFFFLLKLKIALEPRIRCRTQILVPQSHLSWIATCLLLPKNLAFQGCGSWGIGTSAHRVWNPRTILLQPRPPAHTSWAKINCPASKHPRPFVGQLAPVLLKLNFYKVLSYVIDKQPPSSVFPRAGFRMLCFPVSPDASAQTQGAHFHQLTILWKKPRFPAATLCLFGDPFSLGKKGAGAVGGSFGDIFTQYRMPSAILVGHKSVLKTKYIRTLLLKKCFPWEFPGGPVVRTRHFHCWRPGFKRSIPGRGTKIPQATRCSQQQQTNKQTKTKAFLALGTLTDNFQNIKI